MHYHLLTTHPLHNHYPSKQQMFTNVVLMLGNAGPTLKQHWVDICACWDGTWFNYYVVSATMRRWRNSTLEYVADIFSKPFRYNRIF